MAKFNRIIGVGNGDQLEASSSGVRDMNGDGVSDIIIGAPGASHLARAAAGGAYVIYGSKDFGGSIDIATLDSSIGFSIFGAKAGDNAGSSISGAGDFNADGIHDVIVGAPGDYGSGAAYIVYGRHGENPDIDLAEQTPVSTEHVDIPVL